MLTGLVRLDCLYHAGLPLSVFEHRLGARSFDDLKPLLKKLPEMDDNVCVHIVRGVCSLLSSTLL